MSFVARCFQRRTARRAAIQMSFVCAVKILHSEQNPGPSAAPNSLWGEHTAFFLSFLFLFPTFCCAAL